MSLPVNQLQPGWVEFTDTKGVLRCLRPGDDQKRAKGMIFLCPSCKFDKQKRHFCIFLFPDAPPMARPHGRFVLHPTEHKKVLSEIKSFSEVTLHELIPGFRSFGINPTTKKLTPRDVCGWTGSLIDGTVKS